MAFCLLTFVLSAQSVPSPRFSEPTLLRDDYLKVQHFFEEAYALHPSLPRGCLEAISYQYRRFSTVEPDYDDCDHTIPRNHTVMGLTIDGKGVFRENLKLIDSLSSFTASEMLASPRAAILAYAEAFSTLQERYQCYAKEIEAYKPIFIALSELPYTQVPTSWQDNYPLNCFLYEIYRFLSDTSMTPYVQCIYSVNFEALFGDMLPMLRAGQVSLSERSKEIQGITDYSSATWLAASSCNYTVGRGNAAISNITIHYTQGTYAGTLAWFQNCSAMVSAHYIIRSSDGQVTQMVRESDKAWHVGSANGYTIGIEHEAYGNIASFFTDTMYKSSALLIRDICSRRPNISPKRVFYRDTLADGTVLNAGVHNLGGAGACTQIRGHQHYPNQSHTDPGPYWNWNLYYRLINVETPTSTETSSSGTFYDSGGPNGDYGADEHQYILINCADADSIELMFDLWDVEADYDFLWVFDGNSPSESLIGRWSSTPPGRIVSSGPSLLVEFRSDCATNKAGWAAHWNAFQQQSQNPIIDTTAPQTEILLDDSLWITRDFDLLFQDSDDHGVAYRFWQIMEKGPLGWHATPKWGFLCDNFDNILDSSTWISDGSWDIVTQRLTCADDDPTTYHRIFARHHDSTSNAYLYDFYLNMGQTDSCSFFFHLPDNADLLTGSGFEIRFVRSSNTIALYQISNGVLSLLAKSQNIYISQNTAYLYRVIWDKDNHKVFLFRHGQQLLGGITDTFLCHHSSLIAFMGQAGISIDNMRVYAGRSDSMHITVGPADTCMIRTQALHGMAQCKVKSVVVDQANLFSAIIEKPMRIDYTPPSAPSEVIATIYGQQTNREANIPITCSWLSSIDNESGVSHYEYKLLLTSRRYCLKDEWHKISDTSIPRNSSIPIGSISCKIYVRCLDEAGNTSAPANSADIFSQ